MSTKFHDDPDFWAITAVAGDLTETEFQIWNAHIIQCPSCKKRYEEELLKFLHEAIESERPDPGFERRIISKFRQVHCGNKRPVGILRFFPIMIGAAIGIAVMAFIEIGSFTHTEKPTPVKSAALAMDLSTLPAKVQETIRENLAGRTVSGFQRTVDDDEVSYDVETKSANGEEWDMTVAEDGALQTLDVPIEALPSSVQTALHAHLDNGSLDGVEKLFDGGEVSYKAGITASNGDDRDFTFAADGTLESQEIRLAELPVQVQSAIKSQVGSGKLEGIDETFDNDDDGIAYDATMTTRVGRERDFTISKDGNLISREVLLNEIPAVVRRTISQTLDKGKVVEINQSFVAENQVMPYEIDGEKNGKPFDFTISPSGKILAMEE